jgi:hypothetical protein
VIASAADPPLRLATLALVALAACATPTAPPGSAPLEPLPTLARLAPDVADLAARDAARAALGSDAAALDASVGRIAALDAERARVGDAPTGLLPYALDLENATRGDARAQRRAARELLERDDLDASLRARLEAEVQDDPLRLANARLADARRLRAGRLMNALFELLGRSLLSGALVPIRLVRSVLGLALAEHAANDMSTPERQALAQWKSVIETDPGSPEAAALLARVEESQRRWYRDQRTKTVRRARRALDAGDDASALVLADRALHFAPEDRDAIGIRSAAEARIARARADRERSLDAAADPDLSGRTLAVALLAQPGAIGAEADRLLAADPRGPLADEARFARTIPLADAGDEVRAWRAVEEVARRSGRGSNMSRHAWAELASPEQNPERAFRAARAEERGRQLRWLAFGPLARGARDRDLPRAAEWALEVPSVLDVVVGLPSRILFFPWQKPESPTPAIFARRYLAREPDGVHAPKLRAWLVDFEADRENWVAALAFAEQDAEVNAGRLAKLRERAARQTLDRAREARRRDLRMGLLQHTAREWPDTEAGREAAGEARTLAERATPLSIRMTRGFLRENPGLAGPEGLALRPELLDGELANGELHRQGVSFLGGLVLELAFVNERGDEGGEPLLLRERISEERLARTVALLEEASLREGRLDPDLEAEPDADRDLFFERARLGLADAPDPRAAAESSFVFESARERYGMVRARESILPVDLVLQVSGTDLGLGAFPRVRPPKPTPDAVLYE